VRVVSTYTGRLNNIGQSLFEFVPVEFDKLYSCVLDMVLYSFPIDIKFKPLYDEKSKKYKGFSCFEDFFHSVTKKSKEYF
jgi:hypothetical protein